MPEIPQLDRHKIGLAENLKKLVEDKRRSCRNKKVCARFNKSLHKFPFFKIKETRGDSRLLHSNI